MEQKVPEVIRVGAAGGRIVRVTAECVEYIDMAGREGLVDLGECARNWMRYHDERREDFIPVGGASQADIDAENARIVGKRGGGATDAVWWVELMNDRKTRFEFETWEALGLKLRGPLMRAGWLTFDTE